MSRRSVPRSSRAAGTVPVAPAATLALKTAETLMAAPQVVAHRLGRLAAAGAAPSARDRQEFQRMGTEKVAAFQESWMAMALQAFTQQQRFAASMLRWWTDAWRAAANPLAAGTVAVSQQALGRGFADLSQAWLGIAGRGLAPVHRRAVANARRLSSLHVPPVVATPLTRRASGRLPNGSGQAA